MATIRKLPSGSWNVQVRRNGRRMATSTHSSREDAEVLCPLKTVPFEVGIPG